MDMLKAMKSFAAVSELNGFATAARTLGLSPPAITRDIAALERRLGCKLFQRTTRQIRLTEAGVRFLADTRKILAEIDDAESSLMGAQADLCGKISVTAPATFGRLQVGPRIVDFSRQNPGIVFTALFVDRVVDLIDEGIDVAVRIAQLPDSKAKAIRVGSVRPIVCASPKYLSENGEPKKPSDLTRLHALDLVESQLPWSFVVDGRQRSIKPPIRLAANSVDLAIQAAEGGCGVVRLLSYQAEEALKTGRLKRILKAFEPKRIPVHVIHFEGRAAARRIRSFVDYLVSELRAEPILRD